MIKLAFPQGEHADFVVSDGSYTIGSDADDDICLGASQLRPTHAVITLDRRGLVLDVNSDGGTSVDVNQRPVTSKAFLKPGDCITLSGVQMVVRTAEPDALDGEVELGRSGDDPGPARIHLRGISGPHSGRAIPLNRPLTLGSPDDGFPLSADVRVQFGEHDAQLVIQAHDGASVEVNGYQVRSAQLREGDQIAIGPDRFVVESAALTPANVYGEGERASGKGPTTQVMQAPVLDDADEAREGDTRNERGGGMQSIPTRDKLIVAALVAASLAMLAWLLTRL